MSDEVLKLLREGKIQRPDYDLYMLFEGNELGRRLLQELIMDTFLSQPENIGTGEAFAYKEGRVSVWRDIKLKIKEIQLQLEASYDRRSKGYDYRNEEMAQR